MSDPKKAEVVDEPDVAEQSGEGRKQDPELLLMGRLNRALQELDEPSRYRVMDYLTNRHGRPRCGKEEGA